ncbi:MAG: hypothetical protein FD174_471 [Geobacteraceae bacterium]|nr:MAG: hypothetical protein FD174_471 [Geobacteraceae bacterium]
MKENFSAIVLSLLVLSAASLQAASQEEVMGVKTRQQGLKVIEEKCLFCHNKQRIDKAVKEQRDMEKIMGRMEKKGAVLTEKERQVLGHFRGQNPLKSKIDTAPPRQKGGDILPR